MRKSWIGFVKFGLPILAAVMLIVAVSYVTAKNRQQPRDAPPIQPPTSPFDKTVAGAGIVESQSENVEVAAPVPDVVESMHVAVDQRVQKGDKLFTLDARVLEAEQAVQRAALRQAQAAFARLEARPRPEEVPVAQAKVNAAKARLQSAQDSLQRLAKLVKENAAAEEDYVNTKLKVAQLEAELGTAKAELELLKAGAWSYELKEARRRVDQQRAALKQLDTEIERRIVRAPITGTVLREEIEPGEFVGTPPSRPLIVLGDIQVKHVRVDINERDIPRFVRGAPAVAVPRGSVDRSLPLRFVRVEPFVIPKQSLTGRTTERVDTRVLQVIYALVKEADQVFVGQQVDVYVDATTRKKKPGDKQQQEGNESESG